MKELLEIVCLFAPVVILPIGAFMFLRMAIRERSWIGCSGEASILPLKYLVVGMSLLLIGGHLHELTKEEAFTAFVLSGLVWIIPVFYFSIKGELRELSHAVSVLGIFTLIIIFF